MRGDRAQQDLHHEQRQHHPEVLGCGAHRRGDPQCRQGIAGRQRQRFVVRLARMPPAQQADAGDQEQHAEGRPHPHRRRRRVVDQRLAGPVIGVCDLLVDHARLRRHHPIARFARTFGAGGPCRPPEERRQRAPMRGIRHGVVLHRIRFAQRGGCGVVAEQALVVRGHVGQRERAVVRQGDRAAGGVVGIGAHDLFQATAQRGLLFFRQLRVGGHAAIGARPQVEQGHRLAMQPVRAPVGRDVAAVAPDRAQLHAADRLPDLAASFDIGAGVDHLAAFAQHLLRHRRRGAEDLGARPQQHPERQGQQDRQPQPQFPGRAHHGISMVCGHGRVAGDASH